MSDMIKKIAENRAARHEYYVLEAYEAGVELFGTEVKSIRNGGVNLKDSWAVIEKGEMFARHIHVSPYEKGNIFNRDPMRDRKLLMHKREIMKLYDKVKKEGLTLVPLSIYLKKSRVKLSIGLCKGKKLHDKRESMAERDVKRQLDRAMKSKRNFE
ncbi:MAG: SsrA-binding protein SmpB [Oscillospiraceae bacterium]|jgi:SsrA-binding protein|nr:SsrA-binding protein SmpB [Oscillospiraceae bacterium]